MSLSAGPPPRGQEAEGRWLGWVESRMILQGLAAGCGAAVVPHRDAAGQDAACVFTVEGAHGGQLG